MTLQDEFNTLTEEYKAKMQTLITKHTSKMYVNGEPLHAEVVGTVETTTPMSQRLQSWIEESAARQLAYKRKYIIGEVPTQETEHRFVNGINNNVKLEDSLYSFVGDTYLTHEDKKVTIKPQLVDKLFAWLNEKEILTLNDFKKISVEELFLAIDNYPSGFYSRIIRSLDIAFDNNVNWLDNTLVMQNTHEEFRAERRDKYVRKVNTHRRDLSAVKHDEREFMLEVRRYRKCLSNWKRDK